MNYPGSKGGAGTYHKIINQLPPHRNYYELFLGTGEIIRRKLPATGENVGVEIDAKTLAQTDWKQYPYIKAEKADAFKFLSTLENHDRNTLVYLDPPYPLQSRKDKRKLYRHELTDEQHIKLLSGILRLKCQVAISTYPNELYARMLQGWRVISFTAGTRGGPATELLYMNYQEPKRLHDYRYLGTDRTDRQRIQRKIEGHVKKLLNLPPLERMAICEAVYRSIYFG